MSANFEIFLGKNVEYYFRLMAPNGKIILGSEGYTTKVSCQNGIESVKKNSQILAQYEKKKTEDKRFYFVLKATNDQIIGMSQFYKEERSRDEGIEAVINYASKAAIMDFAI